MYRTHYSEYRVIITIAVVLGDVWLCACFFSLSRWLLYDFEFGMEAQLLKQKLLPLVIT